MRRCRTLLVAATLVACTSPDVQHVELARSTTLEAGSPRRFLALEALRTPGDNHQVCLAPSSPYAVDDSLWGIRRPDGTTATVFGALLRADGEVDSLESLSTWSDGTQYLCLMLPVGDAPSSTYTGVRLSSDQSIALQSVFWLSTYK
jgi:hypothetical protein